MHSWFRSAVNGISVTELALALGRVRWPLQKADIRYGPAINHNN